MPVQINTWLGVIMEHVEDMACKRRGPASIQEFHPVSSGVEVGVGVGESIINLAAAVNDEI